MMPNNQILEAVYALVSIAALIVTGFAVLELMLFAGAWAIDKFLDRKKKDL